MDIRNLIKFAFAGHNSSIAISESEGCHTFEFFDGKSWTKVFAKPGSVVIGGKGEVVQGQANAEDTFTALNSIAREHSHNIMRAAA